MRLNKKFAAIAITATVALTGTAAFAYWTSSGSGTGSASTGDTELVTVNQLSDVSDLYPGSPAQALSGDFTNPGRSQRRANERQRALRPVVRHQRRRQDAVDALPERERDEVRPSGLLVERLDVEPPSFVFRGEARPLPGLVLMTVHL